MNTMIAEPETTQPELIEIRSGEGYQVAEVNLPKRIVTTIVMPYERPATIHTGAGSFSEIVSRGAFDGIEKRTGQIRANRDHNWDKTVGKIVGLHPSRQEGLVAEVKMFTNEHGEEALKLCDEGGLDASAGFYLLRRSDGRVYDDAEIWERNRSVRRLNRVRLDHVAFVPNPAHPGAVVLDVRQQAEAAVEVATPNRDKLAADIALAEQKARLAEIDRRYLR